MKASEIAAVARKNAPLHTNLITASVSETPVVPVLSEAKKETRKRSADVSASSAAPIFGVDDPNGHVMRRIRSSKPHLMQKIHNWD